MHFRSAFLAVALLLRGTLAQTDLLSALPECAVSRQHPGTEDEKDRD